MRTGPLLAAPSPAPWSWLRAPATMTTTAGPATRPLRQRRHRRATPPRRHPEAGEVVVGAVLEPTSLDIVTRGRRGARPGPARQRLRDAADLQRRRVRSSRAWPTLPEVSDDGTVYTFTLQDGVTFHSGEPLTSADVVWSLDAQRAEGANEAERLAGIASVEAPDDPTVVVTLAEPDNDFAVPHDPSGGRRAAGRRHRPGEHGQRHRAVHVRRVERRGVDHARPQRRLLG